ECDGCHYTVSVVATSSSPAPSTHAQRFDIAREATAREDRSMTLTLEDLVAREEIGDIVKRLARGTDRLDEELIASCYHPDGTDDHNVFRGTGVEFAQWVVDTLPHFQATMHLIGAPRIR